MLAWKFIGRIPALRTKQNFFSIKWLLARSNCTKAPTKLSYDLNTNVTKDVILYKYENPRFFKLMNIFAISQYFFWGYLGYFAFNSLRDVPVDKSMIKDSDPWFKKINLGDSKYKTGLATFSILIGTSSLCLVWMFTLKSIRFLILNKGGKHVTFVTYAPFGKNRMMTVPLSCVSCRENRSTAKVQLPIKVKNTWMHYMLDMKGDFKHPHLFDATVGLYRRI